jgi:hypothetical protein
MKTKSLLITLICVTLSSVCQGQTGSTPPLSLEGVWTLNHTSIKQITQGGDTITVSYLPDIYANPSDCIYPELKFRAEQCALTKDGVENIAVYNLQGDEKMVFWFSAPVEFEYTVQSAHSFALSREYNKYDAENKVFVTTLVRLVYAKN